MIHTISDLEFSESLESQLLHTCAKVGIFLTCLKTVQSGFLAPEIYMFWCARGFRWRVIAFCRAWKGESRRTTSRGHLCVFVSRGVDARRRYGRRRVARDKVYDL